MNIRKQLRAGLAALLTVSTLSIGPGVRADEGMWPFNNVPKAEIKRRYGFDVTDAWLKKVQMASVRFNSGGSGSFVSPDGLVMTNHHIASDTLAKLSTPQKDLVKEGFYAHTRAEEAKAPDLELNVLVDFEDVTARVNAAVKEDMSAADANAARRGVISTISEESTKATGLRSDVVTLYQGGQYNLYRYKKYTDVRLVFAPEFQIAFFGGDPDNFTFPRYCLDLALFRVYENDQPVKIENYFKWSSAGSKDGDLVFVSGHPGSTQRLNTVTHLEYLRDNGQPMLLNYLKRQRTMLNKYGAQSEEKARNAQEDLLGVENALKAYTGQQEGLQDKALMAKKRAAEESLRAVVTRDAKKQKEYGDAWDAVAKSRRALPAYENERRFLESGWGFNSKLFDIARTLVRLVEEDQKPNGERLPEYNSSARESLELDLYSPAPIYEDFETFKLADSLAFMRDELGANNPTVQKVLAGKTPEARAAKLVQGTKLKDINYRKQLVAGGAKAVSESTDPMIVLARAIDKEARAVRKRFEDEVAGVERDAYSKIARALFDTEGTKLYPDATFTLRLSYGAVKGYKEDSKQVAPYTDYAGLYRHAAEHGNKFPYQLPQRWTDAKSTLDLRTPFNFVTTNDIIGGNSGSPIINRNAEIVGLVFDGNIQSLVGNFIYDETQNRTVAVDSRGMVEALRKVYKANEIADELTK
ncbi:MAG: S46 family peptidase [Pyrinomonadaceae bacterium]|nr:S46 family peptidase [Pyrinomonadaceae bacterium]